MTCPILTEERWARLLDGSLDEREKLELLDHLDIDCPDCEYLIEGMTEDDENRFRMLFNEKHAHQKTRIERSSVVIDIKRKKEELQADDEYPPLPSLHGHSPHGVVNSVVPAQHGTQHHSPIWAVGIAATLLLAVGIAPQLGNNDEQQFVASLDETYQFEKGPAKVVTSVGLQFATGRINELGQLDVNRGVLGQQYSASDLLFLHYELPVDGYVYLMGIQEDQDVDLIFPQQTNSAELQRSGVYNIPDGSQVGGIPLTGVQGRYSVVSVFSAAPLERFDDVISSVKQSLNPASGQVDKEMIEANGQEITVDVVYFDVSG